MKTTSIIRRRRSVNMSLRALYRYQGGKQQLCGPIVDLFPTDIRRYFEPFFGAGSLYLELRSRDFGGSAFLGDGNPEIVNVHRVIAADPNGFEMAYRIHDERHSHAYFYWLRSQDTSGWTPVERAARTVYIVKAAFHGLYRINGKGKIASTYGTGEPGRIRLDGARIHAVSAALQGADIRHGDFGWVEPMAEAGDLVFADPPYFGGNDDYSPEGFTLEDHLRLLRMCQALDAKGVSFLQTNSDRPFVRDLYRGFHMVSIPPAPAIGRGAVGKQPVGELIIANYELQPKANWKFEVVP